MISALFTRVNKINPENRKSISHFGMIKRKCANVCTNWNDKAKMSTRMDKTNSENVQSIGQIGMTKRKCLLEFTFCSNVEVEGGGGFEGVL